SASALQNLEDESREVGGDAVLADDRAVGDRVVEPFVMHVRAEGPALRNGVREPELDERIERRARLIQIVDPVVVPDELRALPREARAHDKRTCRLYDRGGDCGAHFIALMLA